MFKFVRKFAAMLALLCIAGAAQAADEFVSLASLPLSASPGQRLFQGQDGCLYGVLQFTSRDQLRSVNGAIYKLSLDGKLTYLHWFPWVPNGGPNTSGMEPSDVLVMARDGFLYGVTKIGGSLGRGVFYRLSTDGEYTVLSHLVDIFGSSCRFAVAGPDEAIYVVHDDRGIARLGFDGSITVIYQPFPTGRTSHVRVKPLSADGSQLAVWWAEPRVDYTTVRTLHIKVLSLPSGAVLQSREIECFGAGTDSPHIFDIRDEEVLAASAMENEGPGRVISFNNQNAPTLIAEVGFASAGGPFIPGAAYWLVSKDGDLFYTTGAQTKGPEGLGGGTEINKLARDGTSTKIGDLDGYPLAAWCEGLDGNIYGVSWGPLVLEPEEPEVTGFSALRTSSKESRALSTRKPAPVRPKAFRYVRDTAASPNMLPIAGRDRAVLTPRTPDYGLLIPVLKNDRDPEKGALSLTGVDSPAKGFADILPGEDGKPAQIRYLQYAHRSGSDSFTYTVKDPQGGVSVGQVCIRGKLKGVFYDNSGYVSQPVPWLPPSPKLGGFRAAVAPNGKFSGSLRINGKTVAFRGTLDYNDRALLTQRIPGSKALLTVELSLYVNVYGICVLDYDASYNGGWILGTIYSGR